MLEVKHGVGIDIGTMNIVASRQRGEDVENSRIRDAFIILPLSSKRSLKMMKNIPFITRYDGTEDKPVEKDIIVVGDKALELASTFDYPIRRPLAEGLLSSKELDSVEILQKLISSVLGKPAVPNEACYFSVPSEPVDTNRDVVYHTEILRKIVANLGYKPYPANEAMAIIYSEAEQENYSAIAISFGSGMTNVALSFNAMSGLEFSISRGGDWIDNSSASALGRHVAYMCSLKEKGVDLLSPKNQEEEAVAFYYSALIRYVIEHFKRQFVNKCKLSISRPIPIIISGGTSKAGNFVNLFRSTFEQLKSDFPIQISEIKHAKDPLNAVADGMLVQALQEE
jgi:hypothetical protein